MSLLYDDGAELLRVMLDDQALDGIADDALASLPRRDQDAALSAFLSDVADDERLTRRVAAYLPQLGLEE